MLQETANSLSSLITKYFDVVDPVYPMIHHESFRRDYEFFWSVAPGERPSLDGSLVALIFVMLAMGTQFVTLPSSDDKEQTAEFYGEIPTVVHEAVVLILTRGKSLGIAPGAKSVLLPRSSFVAGHSNHGPHRLFPHERQSRSRCMGIRRHSHPPGICPRPESRSINHCSPRPPFREAAAS